MGFEKYPKWVKVLGFIGFAKSSIRVRFKVHMVNRVVEW
jgi:hypothetical protein